MITIIIGTYNGAQFLGKQLDSLRNQSHKNLEILIADDQSSDETWKIIQHYADADIRISAIRNPENLGIAANFLSLISRATGDHIAICDQDDIWHKDKLEELLTHIGDASLIYTDSILIDADDNELGGTLLSHLKLPPKQGKHLDLFEQNSLSGHSCLFKKDLKPTILHCSEFWLSKDLVYDMVLGIAASWSMGVKFYSTPLTYHRLHDDNNHNQLLDNASRTRKNYLQRRIERVHGKIKKHLYLLSITESLCGLTHQDIAAVFKEHQPSKRFPNSIYQWRFSLALRTAGLPEKLAKRVSLGKWYYILFKWL